MEYIEHNVVHYIVCVVSLITNLTYCMVHIQYEGILKITL